MWSFLLRCFRKNNNRPQYPDITSAPAPRSDLAEAFLVDVRDDKSDIFEEKTFSTDSEESLGLTTTSATFLTLMDEKRIFPEKKKTTFLTKQEADRSYEISRRNLELCISVLTAHRRECRFTATFPGLMLGVIGAGLAIARTDVVRNLHAPYDAALQRFSHTWANYSVIDYESPTHERHNYYRACKDIGYPISDSQYPNHHRMLYCWTDFACCYVYFEEFIDLRNTTGLRECVNLLLQRCAAFYPIDEDAHSTAHHWLWIGAVLLLAASIWNCICVHWSIVRDQECSNLKLDSDDLDVMHSVAIKNDVFFGDRDEFQEYLSSHSACLLNEYKAALVRLEAKYSKYLSRLMFMKGFSHAPDDKSSMQVCIRPSAEANRFDFKVIKDIFEFANIDKDNLHRKKLARRALLDATQAKNYRSSLNHFFHHLQEKNQDGHELYDKNIIVKNIFKFAGI